MDLGLIKKIDIDAEMQQSYLDYAMSVIVSRALPDARDGLKPVQRRILYAMYDMGLRPNTAYKKSARIVGEVLGKYHPHGDMAVYDAMARMAQDFSMRYLLVDGQGNFGSVDGDPPAAMRYTEARLAPPAIEMLNQIEKNTVNFSSNFDGTLEEPEVLPAALPNLLVNGATGIAVGMATNIPPHNLGEVVDALIYMLDQWDKLDDLSVEDLMRFIQGPDFPTGGVIIQDPQGDGLASAYGAGKGRVIVQARAHLEEMGRGKNRIIVTELPYQANKASLIERIAELVRDGHLEGVADLRDESDRQGMRIVIELSKTAEPEKILRELYHRTPMQMTFGINMLALVGGEPRLVSLKQALRVFLDHRQVIVKRRSEYDLARAKERAHILEGLRIALNNLDEIIALIRASADVDTARKKLIARFKLSEIQAQAILDMPLRRLAALERKKIELEYKEVTALIKELESLLHSPKKMRQVIGDELKGLKEAYGDRRRTQIVRLKEGETVASLLTTTDVTPAENVWVQITADGLVSRTADDELPQVAEGTAPRWVIHSCTHHTLYFISTNGRAAAVAVHAVPLTASRSQGAPYSRLSALSENDPLAAIVAIPTNGDGLKEGYLMTVTRNGMVKKSAFSELPGPSAQSFAVAKVNEGDSLGWVRLTKGTDEILMVTAKGMSIRFSEDEVRPMGLVAAGVSGIKLAAGDHLIGVETVPDKGDAFLLASDGKAKRIPMADFPVQARYGQGVIAWRLAKETQLVGLAVGKGPRQVIVFQSDDSVRYVRLDEAPVGTRATQGKTVAEAKSAGAISWITTPRDYLAWIEGRDPDPEPEKKPRRTPQPPASSDGTAAKPEARDGQAKTPAKKASKAGAVKTGKPLKSTSKSAARLVAAPEKKTRGGQKAATALKQNSPAKANTSKTSTEPAAGSAVKPSAKVKTTKTSTQPASSAKSSDEVGQSKSTRTAKKATPEEKPVKPSTASKSAEKSTQPTADGTKAKPAAKSGKKSPGESGPRKK